MPRRKGSPEPPDIDDLPPGTPCWEYARDSGGPRQGKSVPDQIAALADDRSMRGLVLDDSFVDPKRKGGDAGRVEFNRLLRRLEERPIPVRVLQVWDMKRLARDEGLGYKLLAACYEAGVAIHSVSMPIPGAARRYVESIQVVAAADESRSNGRAVKRGLGAMMKQGYAPGGRPPFPYMTEYHEVDTGREIRRCAKWVLDPEAEAVARQRWQMRLEGASYSDIAAATGYENEPARLSEFFSNPIHCGFPAWWLNNENLDITNCVDRQPITPPLVTVAEWLRCQQKREEHPRVIGSGYPCSGMGRCACGSPIEVHSDGRNRHCLACGAPWNHSGQTCPKCGADAEARSCGTYAYVCTRQRKQKDCAESHPVGGMKLEKAIVREMAPQFTVEHISKAMAAANTALEAMCQQDNLARNRLLEQISALQGELDNLARAIARSGHSETLLGMLQEKEAQVRQLRTELAMIPERKSARSLDPADAVAPGGFEPPISALRGLRPRPLDDGAAAKGIIPANSCFVK